MSRPELHESAAVAAGKFRDGRPAVVVTIGFIRILFSLEDAETLAEAMIRTVRAAEDVTQQEGEEG